MQIPRTTIRCSPSIYRSPLSLGPGIVGAIINVVYSPLLTQTIWMITLTIPGPKLREQSPPRPPPPPQFVRIVDIYYTKHHRYLLNIDCFPKYRLLSNFDTNGNPYKTTCIILTCLHYLVLSLGLYTTITPILVLERCANASIISVVNNGIFLSPLHRIIL